MREKYVCIDCRIIYFINHRWCRVYLLGTYIVTKGLPDREGPFLYWRKKFYAVRMPSFLHSYNGVKGGSEVRGRSYEELSD